MAPIPAAELAPMRRLINATADIINNLNESLKRQVHAIDDTDEKAPATIKDIKFTGLILDSAKLMEARSIQLLFMATNEPFTPSAIMKLLNEVTALVPTLAESMNSYPTQFYTLTYRKELAQTLWQILHSVRKLILEIPQDGVIVTGRLKDRLTTNTALIQNEIENLQGLMDKGPKKAFYKKVKGVEEVVSDVTREIDGWIVECNEEDELDEDDEDEQEDEIEDEDVYLPIDGHVDEVDDLHNNDIASNAQSMIDHLLSEPRRIPKGDPNHIRDRVRVCLRRLRLAELLCKGITKNRLDMLPKFPNDGGVVARLDCMLRALEKLPDRAEDLATSFYALNKLKIDWNMDQLVLDCCAVAEAVEKDWKGDEDVFTPWLKKFQTEIKSGGSPFMES